MTTDHRARATELEERAAAARNPDQATAYATRALVHAMLAAAPEPMTATDRIDDTQARYAEQITSRSVTVSDGGSGFYALIGTIAGHLNATNLEDDDVVSLAELLWSEGYRQTWADAAPQAVGA